MSEVLVKKRLRSVRYLIRRISEPFLRVVLRRRTSLGLPYMVPGAEWSIILPVKTGLNHAQFNTVLRALASAHVEKLEEFCDLDLSNDESGYVEKWPGEHYRLLPSLASAFDCRQVVEIGTWTGLGALAFATAGVDVTTFDLLRPDEITGSHLVAIPDWASVTWRIADLSEDGQFNAHASTLLRADLIFIDGPKDGVFEYRFLHLLLRMLSQKPEPTLLVLDDTRVITMIELWDSLPPPKIDLTSFGHYSGTGLVFLAGRTKPE